MRLVRPSGELRRPRAAEVLREPELEAADARDLMTPELWDYVRSPSNASGRDVPEKLSWETQLAGSKAVSDPSDQTDFMNLLDKTALEIGVKHSLKAHLSEVGDVRFAADGTLLQAYICDPAFVKGLNFKWDSLGELHDARPGMSYVALLIRHFITGQEYRAPDLEELDQVWEQALQDPENFITSLISLRLVDPRPVQTERFAPAIAKMQEELNKFRDTMREPYYQMRYIAAIDALSAAEFRLTKDGLFIKREGSEVESTPDLPRRNAL